MLLLLLAGRSSDSQSSCWMYIHPPWMACSENRIGEPLQILHWQRIPANRKWSLRPAATGQSAHHDFGRLLLYSDGKCCQIADGLDRPTAGAILVISKVAETGWRNLWVYVMYVEAATWSR